MVPLSSLRISRVRTYFGYCRLLSCFPYKTLTFFGGLSHALRVHLILPYSVHNPKRISTFGLADRLTIPRAEAKELIDGYFATYPDVKRYMDESIQRAKEAGYVETIFGRKRYLADINSQNSVVRGYAERNAINAPIQGSAADIIKIAMIRIQNRIEKENLQMKMTLQVHDELNFSVPENEVDIAKKLVVEEMESAIKLKVPLIADCGVGENWLEAH